MDLEERCKQVVAALASGGTAMLALDFDQTIVTVHTGGYWRKSHQELATHVRPVFALLIPEAQRQGMRVAVHATHLC